MEVLAKLECLTLCIVLRCIDLIHFQIDILSSNAGDHASAAFPLHCPLQARIPE